MKARIKMAGQLFRAANGANCAPIFVLICCLYLLSGAFSGMLDVLNKHFQESLGVNKAQSAFVQAVWYGSYFFLAIPSGWMAHKRGYRAGILTGLILAVIGSLLFIPAVRIHAHAMAAFAAFLAALFVVGSGMTFLATVANPYTTVLGPAESAVFRINLAQTCDAMGWTLGPAVISGFIMSKTSAANTGNATIYIPYLIIAGIAALLVITFTFAPMPDLQAPMERPGEKRPSRSNRPLYKEWHFVSAVIAQFLYVAAQTGIFSFFINFIKNGRHSPAIPLYGVSLLPSAMIAQQAHVWHFTEYGAGIMLSVAFGLFTLGRLVGSMILKSIKPNLVLGVYAIINVMLMLLVCADIGWPSVIALLLSFFFMSIMYPTIFALGIRGLDERTTIASGYIVMSILGGAIMPVLMGFLADRYSMAIGFLMPMGCFLVILIYGIIWKPLFEFDVKDPAGDNNHAPVEMTL
jgi:FHS family L-fucose permease-like MFS transporter